MDTLLDMLVMWMGEQDTECWTSGAVPETNIS